MNRSSWFFLHGWTVCIAAAAALLTIQSAVAIAGEARVLISAIGSERATTGNNSKIVTFDGKSHLVWQDSTSAGYFNRIRTYHHETGTWTETVTLNEARDNHARPCITVDRRGYLHVVLSGHNSAITYRRSIHPNDSSSWTPEEKIGSGTYPSLVCGPDDVVLVTARAHGYRGADLIIRNELGHWIQKRLLYRGDDWTGYSVFTTGMTCGPDGTVHFVCNVARGKRGRPGLYQSVGYLRSRDRGESWEKSDGSKVPLPALPNQMDVLAEADLAARQLTNNFPEFPELVASGNIVTDSRSIPYLLYISHLKSPGQLILATHNERGQWSQRTIRIAEKKYPRMRPIGSCFPLSITKSDELHILLELVPFGPDWVNGKPDRLMVLRSEPVKRLVRIYSTDRGSTFQLEPLIEPGSMFNMVNMERPVGANSIPAGSRPPWIYFDGSADYPDPGEIRNNNVYWVPP